MKTKITIDLADYQKENSRVFVGRDFGKQVKELSHINELFNMFDIINIKIPDNTGSINPSFLEEFLYDVIFYLLDDENKIYQKLNFISNSNYNIKADLEEVIDRIKRFEQFKAQVL